MDLTASEHGFYEAALVELKQPGHLLMFGRGASGWLGQTQSTDFGTTWAHPMPNTELPHPLAPPNIARLPDGTLLLVTEPHIIPCAGGLLGKRFVLACQISRDNGISVTLLAYDLRGAPDTFSRLVCIHAQWTNYKEVQYTGPDATQDCKSIPEIYAHAYCFLMLTITAR